MWERTIAALMGRTVMKDLRQLAGTGARMWVRITIYNPRRYDRDNAFGGCKMLFDAIVRLGLARDDREESMCQVVEQEKAPAKLKRTKIEIREMRDGE